MKRRKKKQEMRCAVPKLSFAEAIQRIKASPHPVMVQFSAPWCGACEATIPEVEKAACEVGKKMDVVRVDVDEQPLLAAEYGVENLPTVAIMERGQVSQKTEGSAPAAHFKKMAKKWLKDHGYDA